VATVVLAAVVPSAYGDADQPRWSFFTSAPAADGTETRDVGCFPEDPSGGLTFGCDLDLRSPASAEPWDEPDDSDIDAGPPAGDDTPPTFTTLGDAADAALAGDHPFAGPDPVRPPFSVQREYTYPWTNAWRGGRCDPAVFSGGPNGGNANDANASTVQLFAIHNRLHDWSFEHGFTAERMEDADPVMGRVQGDADGTGVPTFTGRDTAYQFTAPDGTSPTRVHHLWRPVASLWYGPCVDGAFDVSHVAHAYAHAIVDRMAETPLGGSSDSQSRAVQEGLADLLAVAFTGDDVIGAYVAGNAARGARNYAPAANPLNLSDVRGYDQTATQSAQDDAEIVAAVGRDAQAAVGPGWTDLLFDALPLLDATPTMLDLRDALLAADAGAHDEALWDAFARRGFGSGASTTDHEDAAPEPSFASPVRDDEATVTFTADAAAQLFVGQYEAGATPVADTDPGTARDATFDLVPGTYDFVVRATGRGAHRLTRAIPGGSDVALDVVLPANRAATAEGAAASGDGTTPQTLLDDTEGTGWSAPLDADTQVTVDLAGTAPHTVDRVNVSALVQSSDEDTGERFTALRKFALSACVASAGNVQCTAPSSFDAPAFFASPADAFPGDPPRPVAPQLNLRTFDVPDTSATHLRLQALTNQCTGRDEFNDPTLSNDPDVSSDCTDGTGSLAGATDDTVRAAELQVFSAPPEVTQTNTPKPPPGEPPPGDPAPGDPAPGDPPAGAPPPLGPTPGAPPGPVPQARDVTPPVISGLRLGSRRVRRTRGTTIRFRLTEASRVTLTFARRRGRRFVRVATLRVNGRAGLNRVRFRRRTLRPGRYRLTATAVDAAGNGSQPRRARFTLLRR
jgi:hypothetical protein